MQSQVSNVTADNLVYEEIQGFQWDLLYWALLSVLRLINSLTLPDLCPCTTNISGILFNVIIRDVPGIHRAEEIPHLLLREVQFNIN